MYRFFCEETTMRKSSVRGFAIAAIGVSVVLS